MTEVTMLSKAQATLLGQVAGDSLGSLVEFKSPAEIRQIYPDGMRELADGGTFNTLAGQPTDDSEMALLLARSLADKGTFNGAEVLRQYRFWLESKPFDCGITTSKALRGEMSPESQANGALMRISPMGLLGVNYPPDQVAQWAEADAALTHPHPVCLQVNALYALAISSAISQELTAQALYAKILGWASERKVDASIIAVIKSAEHEPPSDFMTQMGWVLIAFHNALYQMLHATSFEAGVIDTVMQGGDTDTNGAIAGALLGALYGREAVPEQWQKAILNCQPMSGLAGVYCPRPRCFWPVDVLDLAAKLIAKPAPLA
jgi:ADP-ribosylglycohydrolase